MADIPALREDCDGAAAGVAVSTGNSEFDLVTGVGGAFSADEFLAGFPSIQVTTASEFGILEMNHAAGTPYLGFALKVVSAVNSNTAIVMGYAGASKGYDLRLQPAGTLQLRNASSSSQWVSPALASGWYWCTLDTTVGAYRLKIYDGTTGALISGGDSGALGTGFTQGALDNTRYGLQSTSSGSIRLARLRGDDAAEPASGIAAGGNPVATHTLTRQVKIDATGSTSPTLSQASGPTATINSSGSPVFVVDLPDPQASNVVLTLTGTDAGDIATQTITVPPPGATSSTRVYTGSAWV